MRLFSNKRLSRSINLIAILSLMQTTSALARPKPNRHNSHHETRTNLSSNERNLIGLNDRQKERLINLLRGGSRNDYVLNPAIRIEIRDRANSLPPGIQKRLARGKSLPPGIAKKILLPYDVNNYLDLSPDVRIVVLGSSVVIVDPLTNIVWDILDDIF
jgi:hypothetical protein